MQLTQIDQLIGVVLFIEQPKRRTEVLVIATPYRANAVDVIVLVYDVSSVYDSNVTV